MSRSSLWTLTAAVLVVALPGCRSGQGPSAARPGAPAAPAAVRQLVGQTRILRHRGNERRFAARSADLARLAGDCDAAVEVTQAALDGERCASASSTWAGPT